MNVMKTKLPLRKIYGIDRLLNLCKLDVLDFSSLSES